MQSSRLIKLSAYAGIIGPLFFGTMLTSLTFIQYDFLLSLGWDPLLAPTFDWPSGLSLGPLGWLMTATFIISGAAMMFFAFGLCVTLRERSDRRVSPQLNKRLFASLRATHVLGPTLMMFAGLFLACLAFTTDPTIRTTPATWHGHLHDLSFVLLGLTLMPAMIVLGFAFRNHADWKDLALYTWLTAALALPTFFIKGAAFYVFLFAVLLWNEMVAVRLKGSLKS